MPRTKLTRAGANKRARENVSELEDLIRDFDVEFENSIQNMRRLHQTNLDEVDTIIQAFKMQLGERILKVTMGDLKKMKTLNEIGHNKTINDLNATVKDTIMRADEGYLTGEASNKSRLTSDSESGVGTKLGKVSTLGLLKSHSKPRRRSQSAGAQMNTFTPGPRTMMSHLKMRTPLANINAESHTSGIPSSHASRSKYRQPLQQKPVSNKRAVSADRIQTIVPKVNPTTPISILRHARVGEMAFSVTGSPVVPASVVEPTANINIPVANGVLSIRPQNLDPAQLDTSLMNKFDGSTIENLRQLKANLDMLMSKFEKRAHH